METIEQLKAEMARLPDRVFLARDDDATDPLEDGAMEARLNGVLLAAPKKVDLDQGQALHALVLHAGSQSADAARPWAANAMLVATDLDAGWVFSAPLLGGNPDKSPGPPPARTAPAAPPATSARPAGPISDASRALLAQGGPRSAGTAWVDVQKLLPLPASTRRLALHVVYVDQASNGAASTLARGAAAGSPAGITLEAAMQLYSKIANAGSQPHGYPRYVRQAQTPEPGAGGAAFVLGRRDAPVGDAPLPMHGAFRLAATPQMLVQPAPPGSTIALPKAGAPAAVLRGMVLLVKENLNQPWKIPLDIPVWSDKPLAAGDVVEAAFSIDLAATLPKVAGTYQVYLAAGPHLIGPTALTITAPR